MRRREIKTRIKTKMSKICCLLFAGALMAAGCAAGPDSAEPDIMPEEDTPVSGFYFPAEEEKHEGTWLIWPHHYTYGKEYRKELEGIWVQMVSALQSGENVHIIAYDTTEKQRIEAILLQENIDMGNVDFVIARSDDVWSRDTGPVFVYDENGKLTIADFAFDGWGKKTPYKYDDKIPQAVATAKNLPIVKIQDFVLEGGAVELDGAGTLLAAKSSVISKNRNAHMTQEEAVTYLRKYLGVTHFIWLDGVTDQDITDAHIDGMARFYDDKTLLTVSEKDFFELYEDMKESDYERLLHAENAKGEPYKLIELPMTAQNAKGVAYKGSYLNYYIGNEVVLVPVYGDENDKPALEILEGLYEGRKIVPIDVTALYQYGGMLHCVTQQQPMQRERVAGQ